MNLTQLAEKYGSDKGNVGHLPHRYTYLYDLLFYPLRDQAINFLEMGLCIGGPEVGNSADRQANSPSVQMWLDYFSIAQIYGFDISDFSHQEGPRFSFTRGDSGKQEDLERAAAMAPHFDVIIDDASHASYHQLLALKVLWSKVSSGGLYVIEDLHWQSPFFEDSLPNVPKVGSFLQAWFERGVYIENIIFSRTELEQLRDEVWSYSGFPSFSEGHGVAQKMAVLRRK